MKKLILLALAAVMMAGCLGGVATGKVDGIEIVTIDSCEYFRTYGNAEVNLAHKGNCRFCKERREKEMKELVELLKEK